MTVFVPPTVDGPQLKLRPVKPEDAAYIHALRLDSRFNRYLSAVSGSVDDQRAWIERYKLHEAKGAEIYYIIERRDSGQSCGTVRLYEIEADRFTWGSWILDHNKTWKAALESAVLSFGVGFDALCKDFARVDARIDNTHANAFYRRLGMSETNRTASDVFYEYPRARYEAGLSNYLQILEAAKNKAGAT